jgi:uncharacterized membrane protein SirB2
VIAAVLSFTGFFVRGIWMMQGSALLKRRWVKIAPHVVDTILLASAVALAVRIRQYPFVHDWLTAKVAALLVYIALGMVALRFGRTRQMRIAAWAAALAIFLYIVGVAVTRQPDLGLASQ